MDAVWLSANRFGHELLKEAVKLDCIRIKAIIILGPESKTVMYDGIDRAQWNEFGIDVIEIGELNNEEKLLEKLHPDVVVMCGWRQLVGKEILGIPKFGFIGFHPTLLPKGRGPAPIINTILEGWTESGTTMFHVSAGIDNGDIIGQEKFQIGPDDHASEVYEKATEAGKKLVGKYLPLIVCGKAPRVPQDDSKATVFSKPMLSGNRIDPGRESAEIIYRKIRAFSRPYKGAYMARGVEKIIIWRAGLE